MKPVLLAVAWALLLSGAAGRAAPPAPSASAEEVRQEVRRLAHPEVETRAQAFRNLLAWGTADPDRILAALPQAPEDAETLQKVDDLRVRIPLHHASADDPALRGAVDELLANPTRQGMDAVSRAAGKYRRKILAPFCEGMLGSADPETRKTAVFHLGCLRLRESAPRLARLAREDPDPGVRCEALKALASVKEKERSVGAGLVECLSDPSERVREQAARTLGEIVERSAVRALLARIEGQEKEASVRRAAVEALGRIGDPSGTAALEALAGDPDDEVRSAAVYSLCQLGGRERVRKFLAGPDPCPRLAAIRAAATLDLKDLAIPVAQFLSDPEPRIRRAALAAAVQLRDPGALTQIEPLLADLSNPRTWPKLAEAVWKLEGKSLAPKLVRFLAEPAAEIRVAAAEALVRLGETSVAAGVETFLDHPDPGVRQCAALVLANFGRREKGTAASAVRLLASKDPKVRELAVSALAALGERSAVPQIVGLIDDPYIPVRLSAVRFCGQFAEISARPKLLALLGDSIPATQGFSARSLAAVGRREDCAALACLLEDEDPGVQGAAAFAMGKLAGQAWGEDVQAAGAWWKEHRKEFR